MIATLTEELRRHEALLKEERQDARDWQRRFEQAQALRGPHGRTRRERRSSRGGAAKAGRDPGPGKSGAAKARVASDGVAAVPGGMVSKVRSSLAQAPFQGGGLGGEMLHPSVEADIREIFG